MGRDTAMTIEFTEFERPRLASTTHMQAMDVAGVLIFEPIPEGSTWRRANARTVTDDSGRAYPYDARWIEGGTVIVGEAVVTQSAYRAAIKLIIRKSARRLRVVGAVLILLGLAALLLSSSGTDISLGLIIVVFGFLFAVIVPIRSVSLSVRRMAPMLDGPWRFEIGEDGVRVITPIASSLWPWRSLIDVVDGGDFWLINTPIRNQRVLVVKSAFSEADQRAIAESVQRKLANQIRPSAAEGVTVRPPTLE